MSANFGNFNNGDLRAIVEEGSWAPVAIATWSVSSDELEFRGMTGKGLDLVHSVGDHLWAMGDGVLPAASAPSVALQVRVCVCV